VTGNDKQVAFPSDLVGARQNVEFTKQGFYSKNAMSMTNALAKDALNVPKDGKHPRVLNRLDPRSSKHRDMLSEENGTVPVNKDLMAEILYENQLRAYERGLIRNPPTPIGAVDNS